jgi:short-subunit dehydrogenase
MTNPIFKDNVVIITGASSGIGEELAYRLAGQGACLALAARNGELLEEVAEKCRDKGGKAIAIPTDVAEEAQCKNLIDRTIGKFGRLDTLVNNAGITMWAKFEDLEDLSYVEKIMQVNYFGSVYCTHYALSHLKQSKGRIVGVSSLTGKTGVPTRSGYAASKHAMAGFFDTLRIELAEYGITVTMIYPGFVATDVRNRAFGADGKPLGTENNPVQEDKVMTVEKCVDIMLNAMEKRKREVVMTTRAKIGLWLKLIAPSMIDNIARKAIERGK